MAETLKGTRKPTTDQMDEPFLRLIPALRRLDQLLEQAVGAAEAAYTAEATGDRFRGLYISAQEVEQILRRTPAAPLFPASSAEPAEGSLTNDPQWSVLHSTFGLSGFDLDVLLIALAPELDLRYERLYAYLQDDVTRRRPTVDLALSLLCACGEDRITHQARFAPNAPLIRHGLLHLVPDPNHVRPPLLAHYLKLDEQIVRLLLHQDGLDSRLVPLSRFFQPGVTLEELPLKNELKRALSTLVLRCVESNGTLRLYFHGPTGAGRRRPAEGLASLAGKGLLTVDLRLVLDAKVDFRQTVKLFLREARLQDAVLYLDGLDVLRCDDRELRYECLLEELAEQPGIVILAGALPWIPLEGGPTDVVAVSFPALDFELRRTCWHAALGTAGTAVEGADLDAIAGRFHLNPDQITQAVAAARGQAMWRTAAQPNGGATSTLVRSQPTASDLFAAARVQSGHDLARLARKIEPKYTWDDIVLPTDQLAQLREICNQAKYRQVVYGEWGFDRKLSVGKGLNVLFAGPPGTGKTMAAEVIASELGLELYKIDLAQVVSKYIGETEKNLDRIFTAARNANAILFFDEADALFGKRSEVKDAHDRYANIEIGYLLQKMEEYEGVAILATNLRQNLDDAFVRRIQVIVEFPFPDQEYRRQIWQVIFPQETPLGEDVDFKTLSCEVKLAGGNIKNIALTAAFYAAADGRVIRMSHLAQAARREHQKIGRTWNEDGWSAPGTLAS